MQTQEYGAVFTKRWMAEMMLDLVGYTADRDLAALVAHEPSCGGGAFLVPMVERLAESCSLHGRDVGSADDAIRAWDLQPQHVDDTRRAVAASLVQHGCDPSVAERLAGTWVSQADYLLRSTDGELLLSSTEGHRAVRPTEAQQADFVIGNPPYIRAESIPRDLREAYVASCETMTAGTDVFVGFIEKGLASLKEGGALCFICADRWMHNAYGRKLRRWVVRDFSVAAVLKMHGVDAFAEEVSAYPAITIIRRSTQGKVLYAEASPRFDADAAARLASWAASDVGDRKEQDFTATRLPAWFNGDGLWPSGSPERLKLLEDLEERLPPLQDPNTGTRVGIGIATGADRIFITDDPSVAEEERLLPLVKSAHLKTGEVKWADTWLVNPWASDGSLVDLTEWPKMARYFDSASDALKKRHVAKRSGDGWYRTIDKVHAGLDGKPKLLFQDMKRTSEPVLESGLYYPHHNLYWITSEAWDLRVLGGLLLSRVAQMFIEAYAVRMRGGTLRFQAQYLRKIRLPAQADLSESLQRRLSTAFDCRDVEEATAAALQAYGLKALPD